MRKSRRRAELLTTPVVYPVGTFLRTENGIFYITAPGRRLRLITERVLDSWSPPRVVPTSEAAVSKYKVSAKMKFRNGSLIWNLYDGKLYLIESGKRRHIVSPDALTRINAKKDDAFVVSKAEINLHELGEELV